MERTEQVDMENSVRQRRLRWLGHMWRMVKDRRANQILHCVPGGRKRGERPRKNWTVIVKNDLRGVEISWEMADGQSRVERMRCPMCIHVHVHAHYGLRQWFRNFFEWHLPC